MVYGYCSDCGFPVVEKCSKCGVKLCGNHFSAHVCKVVESPVEVVEVVEAPVVEAKPITETFKKKVVVRAVRK